MHVHLRHHRYHLMNCVSGMFDFEYQNMIFQSYFSAPPTFEEAMNATSINVNDDANAIGSQAYVPRYPVYKFGGPEKC